MYVFGAPKIVLTDQGSNFTSTLIKNFAKLCNIKFCITTAFIPQSNGSIERMHHSLTEWLKNYISRIKNWDGWLECACFSYNTSIYEGTKLTPFKCVFGRIARVPSGRSKIDEDHTETYRDYLTRLKGRLIEIKLLARENLGQVKIFSKEYYDARANPCSSANSHPNIRDHIRFSSY